MWERSYLCHYHDNIKEDRKQKLRKLQFVLNTEITVYFYICIILVIGNVIPDIRFLFCCVHLTFFIIDVLIITQLFCDIRPSVLFYFLWIRNFGALISAGSGSNVQFLLTQLLGRSMFFVEQNLLAFRMFSVIGVLVVCLVDVIYQRPIPMRRDVYFYIVALILYPAQFCFDSLYHITQKESTRKSIFRLHCLFRSKSTYFSRFVERLSGEFTTDMEVIIPILQYMKLRSNQREIDFSLCTSSFLCKDMIRTFDDLKLFYYVNFRKFTLQPEKFDILNMIGELIKMERVVRLNGCEGFIQIDLVKSGVPKYFFGDRQRIRHIINDTLSNAIRSCFLRDGSNESKEVLNRKVTFIVKYNKKEEEFEFLIEMKGSNVNAGNFGRFITEGVPKFEFGHNHGRSVNDIRMNRRSRDNLSYGNLGHYVLVSLLKSMKGGMDIWEDEDVGGDLVSVHVWFPLSVSQAIKKTTTTSFGDHFKLTKRPRRLKNYEEEEEEMIPFQSFLSPKRPKKKKGNCATTTTIYLNVLVIEKDDRMRKIMEFQCLHDYPSNRSFFSSGGKAAASLLLKKRSNIRLLCAKTGEEAANRIEQERFLPDLIFCDHQPCDILNGYEFIINLQSSQEVGKVFKNPCSYDLMIMYSSSDRHWSCLGNNPNMKCCGIDCQHMLRTITKPIHHESIHQILNKCLGKKLSQSEGGAQDGNYLSTFTIKHQNQSFLFFEGNEEGEQQTFTDKHGEERVKNRNRLFFSLFEDEELSGIGSSSSSSSLKIDYVSFKGYLERTILEILQIGRNSKSDIILLAIQFFFFDSIREVTVLQFLILLFFPLFLTFRLFPVFRLEARILMTSLLNSTLLYLLENRSWFLLFKRSYDCAFILNETVPIVSHETVINKKKKKKCKRYCCSELAIEGMNLKKSIEHLKWESRKAKMLVILHYVYNVLIGLLPLLGFVRSYRLFSFDFFMSDSSSSSSNQFPILFRLSSFCTTTTTETDIYVTGSDCWFNFIMVWTLGLSMWEMYWKWRGDEHDLLTNLKLLQTVEKRFQSFLRHVSDELCVLVKQLLGCGHEQNKVSRMTHHKFLETAKKVLFMINMSSGSNNKDNMLWNSEMYNILERTVCRIKVNMLNLMILKCHHMVEGRKLENMENYYSAVVCNYKDMLISSTIHERMKKSMSNIGDLGCNFKVLFQEISDTYFGQYSKYIKISLTDSIDWTEIRRVIPEKAFVLFSILELLYINQLSIVKGDLEWCDGIEVMLNIEEKKVGTCYVDGVPDVCVFMCRIKAKRNLQDEHSCGGVLRSECQDIERVCSDEVVKLLDLGKIENIVGDKYVEIKISCELNLEQICELVI